MGGSERRYAWSQNYIVVDRLKAGDAVDIRFPMVTETFFRVIGADTTYKLTVKGYTVVDIEPKGSICPSYCRDAYKGDTAPVKRVRRFVSGKKLVW